MMNPANGFDSEIKFSPDLTYYKKMNYDGTIFVKTTLYEEGTEIPSAV